MQNKGQKKIQNNLIKLVCLRKTKVKDQKLRLKKIEKKFLTKLKNNQNYRKLKIFSINLISNLEQAKLLQIPHRLKIYINLIKIVMPTTYNISLLNLLNRPKNLLKRILLYKLGLLVKEMKTFLSNSNISNNQQVMWYLCNSVKRRKNNNKIMGNLNNKFYNRNNYAKKNRRNHKIYCPINKSKCM
jgi:hypothetical protein